MNLKYIVENLHRFQPLAADRWGSSFASLLYAMFEGFLDSSARDYIADLLDPARVQVLEVINVPFSSDEDCIVQVLVIDRRAVGLCCKFGDRSERVKHILDVELYRSFARELVAASLEHRLKNLEESSLESLGQLENDYVKFLGAKGSMFAVENAKAACSFSKIVGSHRAFMVDTLGKVQPVEKVGRFTNTKAPWDNDPSTNNVSVTIDGEERVVDGRELMFELVAGQADLEDATAGLTTKARWTAETVDERNGVVKVASYLRYRRIARYTQFRLEPREEVKRFVEAYFDHDQEFQFNNGFFSLESIGFEGTVLSLY